MKRTKIMLLIATTVLGAGLLSACSKKHVHSYGEWEVKVAATHTSAGVQCRHCECGEEEEAPLPKLGEHNHGEWVIVTQATHLQEGLKRRTCECGDVEEEVIPKLTEHTWSEWTVTTPATHLEEGVKVRTCACGALETVTMPKLDGHVWGEWTVKKAATHLEEGEEERFCSCGERESRVLAKLPEHTWSEWSVKTAATHLQEGVQHRTCACGAEETAPIAKDTGAHSWSEWTTVTPATHTTEGQAKRTCACGAEDFKAIAKLSEHEWSEWEVTLEATCTEDGTQCRTCSCGDVQEQIIPAAGHTFDKTEVVTSPTFGTSGVIKRHCSTCDQWEQQNIPAYKINWSDSSWIKEPTNGGTDGVFEFATNYGKIRCTGISISKIAGTETPATCLEGGTVDWSTSNIANLKVIRDFLGVGLKEAKEIIENVAFAIERTTSDGTTALGHSYDADGHCTREGCDYSGVFFYVEDSAINNTTGIGYIYATLKQGTLKVNDTLSWMKYSDEGQPLTVARMYDPDGHSITEATKDTGRVQILYDLNAVSESVRVGEMLYTPDSVQFSKNFDATFYMGGGQGDRTYTDFTEISYLNFDHFGNGEYPYENSMTISFDEATTVASGQNVCVHCATNRNLPMFSKFEYPVYDDGLLLGWVVKGYDEITSTYVPTKYFTVWNNNASAKSKNIAKVGYYTKNGETTAYCDPLCNVVSPYAIDKYDFIGGVDHFGKAGDIVQLTLFTDFYTTHHDLSYFNGKSLNIKYLDSETGVFEETTVPIQQGISNSGLGQYVFKIPFVNFPDYVEFIQRAWINFGA